VKRLAGETPALLIVFDLLAAEDGKPLIDRPLAERRKALEAFARKNLRGRDRIRLSPATADLADAERWLKQTGAMLDGIIAKRADLAYLAGERGGMQKIKNYRSGRLRGRRLPLQPGQAHGGVAAARALRQSRAA
jgi:ATP-dependent DNA ligase